PPRLNTLALHAALPISALTPYSFNLTRSRQLLQAAGYFPAAPPSIWETWGFAVTVMALATAITLAALYAVEVRRNRRISSSPSADRKSTRLNSSHVIIS